LTRKIIQISAVAAGSTNDETLYALADDGSAWYLILTDLGDPQPWLRLPDLPQDDNNAPPQT
jgi:hypothetical protein